MSEIELTDDNELGADDPTGEVLPLDGEPEGEEPDPTARPLRQPAARNVAERRIAGRLGGYVTSGAWLPSGLWPELDQARAEHGRLRGRCRQELDALAQLERDWRVQDADFVDRLKQAAKAGEESPADQRTAPAEREAKRAAALDKCWAALAALADVVDATVELVREHEEAWLAGLREEYAQAEARVREAEKAVRDAQARGWELAQLGRWLQGVSDGEHARGQPAPRREPRPRTLNEGVVIESLTRPWHRPQPTAA